MFSEAQYTDTEILIYSYFVGQEPLLEVEKTPSYPTHVYEENGVYYCASSTQNGVYWYVYCLNNPLIYTDPSGEFLLAMGISAGISGLVGYISGRVAGLRGEELFRYTMASMVIGGVSAGFGAGISATVSAAFSSSVSAFVSGAVSGLAGGTVGGFIGGAGMALNSNASLGTDINTLNAGLKGGLVGGVLGGVMGGISGGLQNSSNDLTFFKGELSDRNWLAYEYTVDVGTGSIQQVSSIGGSDFHIYHFGYDTGNGAFRWFATRTVEGANTINSFRFWHSTASTVSAFSVPAANLTGYFLEPKGPSTTTPNQNRRVPRGTYNLTPNTNSYPNDFKIYNSQVSANRGITIHSGNYPSHTTGCLLPGTTWSGGDAVSSSYAKLLGIRQFVNTVGYQNVRLNIYDLYLR